MHHTNPARGSVRVSLLALAVASFAAFGAAGCQSDDDIDADASMNDDRRATGALKRDAQDLAGDNDGSDRVRNRDFDADGGPESDGDTGDDR